MLFGTFSGGLGDVLSLSKYAELSGGIPITIGIWQGAVTGAIVSGLNHWAHMYVKGQQFKKEVKEAFGAQTPSPSKETVYDAIVKVPTLKRINDTFGGAKIDYIIRDSGPDGCPVYTWSDSKTLNDPTITFYNSSFGSYLELSQIIYHEFTHYNDYLLGTIYHDYLKYQKEFSRYTAGKIATYLSEMRAYYWGYQITGFEYETAYGYQVAKQYLDRLGVKY